MLDIELIDDDTETGGTSFCGETLRDFLEETGMSCDTPLTEINKALKECGIEPIKEIE